MSKIKLFIQLLLVLISFVLLTRGYNIYQLALQESKEQLQQNQCQYKLRFLSSNEMIVVKSIIEGLIKFYEIDEDLQVELVNDVIIVKSKNQSTVILENANKYAKFSQFLQSLSHLPYEVSFSNVCIGLKCDNNIVNISMKFRI